MAKELVLKLSNNNKHLNNIFSDSHFLEIGNIGLDAIERLLNNEVLSIDEVAYFPIQKKGIGHSTVSDDYLNNILPYLYFININLKNIANQLFITYGLLKHHKEKREEFTPIILIPVKFSFDSGKILIHKIATPIINPHVTKYFGNRSMELASYDFNSIYDIDSFLVNLNKHSDVLVELENYLTFGEVVYRDYVINPYQFSLSIDDDKYFNRMHIKGDKTYFLDPLNSRQRKAVYASTLDKSFTIIGGSGTGKTQTLKNILLNALYDGKKVLYLSNMKETLDDISSYLNNLGLRNIYANLNDSFELLYRENKDSDQIDFEAAEIDLKELNQKYDYIDEMESKINGRILDHRFIDVLGEVTYLGSKKTELLDIDDLSKIYKSEYERIIDALNKISDSLKVVGKFSESNWKAIPIFNSIPDSSIIKDLIAKIYDCFKSFYKIKLSFEKDFNTINIKDYAMLRKTASDINNIDINLIPDSWKDESLDNYKKAVVEFKTIKDSIYLYKELNRNINQIIDSDKNNIDIDFEYNRILGPFYNKDSGEVIDSLLEKRSIILPNIHRMNDELNILKNNINSINEISGFEFNTDNDILELIRLKEFLVNHDINQELIKAIRNNDFDNYYLECEKVINDLNELNNNIKDFFVRYPKYKRFRINDALTLVTEYSKTNSRKAKRNLSIYLRRHLGRGDFNEQVESIEKFISNSLNQKEKKESYFVLTTKKYQLNNNYLKYLNEFKDYFENINNDKIKEVIVNIMEKLVDKENKHIIKTLSSIEKIISDWNDLVNLLNEYKINIVGDYCDRYDNSINAINYLKDLYSSNDRLNKELKEKNGNFVPSKIYFNLKEISDKRNEIIAFFNDRSDYNYLFGDNYHSLDTDIGNLSEVIDSYDRFTKAFVSSSGYLNSLNIDTYNNIKSLINEYFINSEELNKVFKIYSHIFNDGVTRYYYTDLDEVLVYLELLTNSNLELVNYLTVTRGLKVLDEYGLEKLISYIVNLKDSKKLVDEFKYTYFKVLEEDYLKRNPILLDYNNINIALGEILKTEEVLINNNRLKVITKLRKEALKSFSSKRHYNNYNDYIRHSNKALYLSSSDICNLSLDKDNFDLVIIDDAHLLPSSVYSDIIFSKQVIISGQKVPHTAVIDNLISTTRNLATISLDYRYSVLPKKFSNYLGLPSIINLRKTKRSKDIEVVESNLSEAIYKLYLANPNIKINIFIKRYDQQRFFIGRFTKYLLSKKVERNEIVQILENNIFISDLNLGYVTTSDVNICNLEDYYNIDTDYICDNLLNYLFTPKTKVIIYDGSSNLDKDYEFKFFNEIKKLINNKDVLDSNYNKETIDIKNKLASKEFKTMINSNDLIYRYNDEKLIANIILWSATSSDSVINIYRDLYFSHIKEGYETKFVTLLELAIDYNEALNKLKRDSDV